MAHIKISERDRLRARIVEDVERLRDRLECLPKLPEVEGSPASQHCAQEAMDRLAGLEAWVDACIPAEGQPEVIGVKFPQLKNTIEAAQFLGLSAGTLNNYRMGDCGPKFTKVRRKGQKGPPRVRYQRSDLIAWKKAKTCSECGSWRPNIL